MPWLDWVPSRINAKRGSRRAGYNYRVGVPVSHRLWFHTVLWLQGNDEQVDAWWACIQKNEASMILLSLFSISQYIFHCYFSIKFIHSTQNFKKNFFFSKMNIKIASNADFLRTLIELAFCLNGDALEVKRRRFGHALFFFFSFFFLLQF